MMGRFTSAPLRVPGEAAGGSFKRADIVFDGVDQSGPSYEARVFLNNPQADAHTKPTPSAGYAGSFHVYGYGLWPDGDVVSDASPEAADEVRAPMSRYITATDALRSVLARGDEVTVTVVPVFYGTSEDADVNVAPERVSIVLDGRRE